MNQTAWPLLLFMLSKIHRDLNCISSVNTRDCTKQSVCPYTDGTRTNLKSSFTYMNLGFCLNILYGPVR